jgi:hypothetical protein
MQCVVWVCAVHHTQQPSDQHLSDFFCNRTFSECSIIHSVWESVVSFGCRIRKRFAARRKTSFPPVLAVCARQDCGHHSVSVLCVKHWRGSIYKKQCTQSTQLAHMGNGESSCYSSLTVPSKIWCWCLGQNSRWLHNQTTCNIGSYQWSALYWSLWRNPSTFTGGNASTRKWEHVVSTQCSPSPFGMLSA